MEVETQTSCSEFREDECWRCEEISVVAERRGNTREAPWQQPRFQFHIQRWPERPPQPQPPGHRPVQHYLWRCWPSLASSSHRQPCLLCLFCLAGNILGQHLINFAFCGKCVPFHVIYNKIQYFTLVSRRPHKVDISPHWQSRQWSPVSSSRARVLIYQHSCIRAQQAPS